MSDLFGGGRDLVLVAETWAVRQDGPFSWLQLQTLLPFVSRR